MPPATAFTPHLWPWQVPPAFRRRWRRYWISDPFFGVLHFVLHHIGRILPIDWCSAIGGFFGLIAWRFGHRTDRARIGYVYAALTGAAPDAVGRVVRGLFVHLGRVGFEYSTLDRLWSHGRIATIGEQHLLAARQAGRPVIVMGLHLGNWEVIAPTLIGLGLRGTKAFYQPRRSRFITHILCAARERYGVILLTPGIAAARTAQRLLVEDRGVLLVYGDEERHRRVCAPSFGRPLPAHANLSVIARLARMSGAAVIPAYVERLRGAHFRVTFLPPVALEPETEADDIARLDRTIEPPILAHLDQWYMLTEETVEIRAPDWTATAAAATPRSPAAR